MAHPTKWLPDLKCLASNQCTNFSYVFLKHYLCKSNWFISEIHFCKFLDLNKFWEPRISQSRRGIFHLHRKLKALWLFTYLFTYQIYMQHLLCTVVATGYIKVDKKQVLPLRGHMLLGKEIFIYIVAIHSAIKKRVQDKLLTPKWE